MVEPKGNMFTDIQLIQLKFSTVKLAKATVSGNIQKAACFIFIHYIALAFVQSVFMNHKYFQL